MYDLSLDQTLSDLISRRDMPSHTQRTQLRHVIRDRETLLDDIDERIASLQKGKDTVKEQISDIRDVISPVRLLPNELLLEIFRYVVRPAKTDRRTHETRTTILMTKDNCLLDLGSVCSLWRLVINNSSEFWGDVDLDISYSRYRRVDDYLNWRLSRGETFRTSLDVSFSDLEHKAASWPHCLRSFRVVSGILPHTKNISDLNLKLPRSSINRLSEISAGSFPVLSSLSLTCTVEDDASVYLRGLEGCHSLTSLQLEDQSRPSRPAIAPDLLPLEYGKIKDVRICSCSSEPGEEPYTILQLVTRCTNMEERSIGMYGTGESLRDKKFEPVLLPSLKLMNLSVNYDQDGSLALSVFTLPKLEDLCLQCMVWDNVLLQAFKDRSAFQLRRLTLCEIEAEDVDLFYFCSGMLSLDTLFFGSGVTVSWRLLDLIQTTPPSGALPLPSLRRLHIELAEVGDISEDGLEAYVKALVLSRWSNPTVARWDSIWILLCEPDDCVTMSAAANERFDVYRKQGLELFVSY